MIDGNRLVFAFDAPVRRVAAQRWRWVVMPVRGIIAGMLALAGLFVLAVHLLIGQLTPVAIVGVVLLVAGLGLLAVWRVRNRQQVVGGRTKLVLDDRGIATHVAAGTVALSWERFERWLEDDDDFVVVSRVDQARGVVVLPKARMPENEQRLVRELLDEKIDPDADDWDQAFVEEPGVDEPEVKEPGVDEPGVDERDVDDLADRRD